MKLPFRYRKKSLSPKKRGRKVSSFERHRNHSSFKFLFKKKVKHIRRNIFESQKLSRLNNVSSKFVIVVTENCELQRFQVVRLRLLLNWIVRRIKEDSIDFSLHANFIWPKTTKPGLRMGTGKGRVSHVVTFYRRGEMFLEIDECYDDWTKQRLIRCLSNQLPVKFKIVKCLK